MKTLVVISNKDSKSDWKFDQILALISYDVEMTLVFMGKGCYQLAQNKAWKSLRLYGVDNVYTYNSDVDSSQFLINTKKINTHELKLIINESEVIL